MDEMLGLRIFVSTVTQGSFSAAARRLGLPPSSISRHIAALEKQLGAELLTRTTRMMGLTEAGRVYHAHARRILADLEAANTMVSAMEKAPQGTLALQTRASISARVIAPLLPEFLSRYSGISVRIHVDDRSPDTVPDGIDVVIRFGLGASSSLKSQKIIDTHRLLLASPSYLAQHGVPVSIADLTSHNCLVFPVAPQAMWRFEGATGTHDHRPRGNLQVNDVDALRAAMIGGLGISVLHEWMVRDELRSGKLVPLLREYKVTTAQTFSTAIYAVYHQRQAKTAKIKAFMKFLLEHSRASGSSAAMG
jgi:DNA-binding transcriptional LysR family regulator